MKLSSQWERGREQDDLISYARERKKIVKAGNKPNFSLVRM